MRVRSYKCLIERFLWEAVYYHVGNSLFEPQKAYWETLPLQEKWEQVGRHVHELAVAKADEAVKEAMRLIEAPTKEHTDAR
jgi:hypothetical protein